MEKIESIMQILKKHFAFSERTTLNRMKQNQRVSNSEAFKILISCLLSLRTQDKNTEKASNNLFQIASTPEEILALDINEMEKLIYKSGHYKKKSRILKSVSSEILNRFNGIVPDTEEELLSIKFVGRKTANIVLNFAFGKDVLPIDTHCHRIPNRIGVINTKKPEETEIELQKILPKEYWKDFNGIFVLFGKTICLPISPKCSSCPINENCQKIGVEKFR
ncbi:endonuclease III [Candidatus Pacearchaeota archaeon]|nr:endonuclease III [Candidatus Pacearchaeota archaeon]